MIQRRGADMEDVKELIAEFKHQWKYGRRELVESGLTAFWVLIALYVMLVWGSMENPR